MVPFFLTECLAYIAQALERDPGYVEGKVFLHQILNEQPSLNRYAEKLFINWLVCAILIIQIYSILSTALVIRHFWDAMDFAMIIVLPCYDTE